MEQDFPTATLETLGFSPELRSSIIAELQTRKKNREPNTTPDPELELEEVVRSILATNPAVFQPDCPGDVLALSLVQEQEFEETEELEREGEKEVPPGEDE